jgi:tetratricopeptide (TPR) repeat protein
MTAAWSLSVSILHQRLPEALELLRCCAFFGPEPIPRDVLRPGAEATGTQVNELISDPIRLTSAIRELGRFALVKIDGRMITVHRLVQALLRDELPEAKRAEYRHEGHLILASGAPSDPGDSRQWPRYSALLAHASSTATDLASCGYGAVRTFALNVVRYLYNFGDFESSLGLAERFIERWTAVSGMDTPNVIDAQRHRGNALRQLGRYAEAYEAIDRTLTASHKVLGETNPLTLALRNAFGADWRARGDFAKARTLDEETLVLHERVFGPSDPQTLRVMNNLALDHMLNSDYVAARDLFQHVYALQNEGGSRISVNDVEHVLNGLAWDLRMLGSFAQARDMAEDALDYCRDRLGPDHPGTLYTAKSLSIALRRLGNDDDRAFELASQVHGRNRTLLGERHPSTLASALNLANALRMLGQSAEAAEQAQKTVEGYSRVYGKKHPYYQGCIGNLALYLREGGDAQAARDLNEGALARLDGTLGVHHYTLTVAANLASDLAALGDFGAARTLGAETLSRSRQMLGDIHPMTLGCAANLMLDLRGSGSATEADALFAEVTLGYGQTIGANHPEAKAAAAGERIGFDFDPPGI